MKCCISKNTFMQLCDVMIKKKKTGKCIAGSCERNTKRNTTSWFAIEMLVCLSSTQIALNQSRATAYPSHNKEDFSQVLTSASCPTWVFVKKCPSNKLIQSLEKVNMSCLESVLPVLLPILQHATDFAPLIHSSSAYH